MGLDEDEEVFVAAVVGVWAGVGVLVDGFVLWFLC